MTRKQLTTEIMRQILHIVLSASGVLMIFAFKAPFIFKKNVETELNKKADRVEMYDELDKKVNKDIYDMHIEKDAAEYRSLVEKLDSYDKNVDRRFNDIKELIKANR